MRHTVVLKEASSDVVLKIELTNDTLACRTVTSLIGAQLS